MVALAGIKTVRSYSLDKSYKVLYMHQSIDKVAFISTLPIIITTTEIYPACAALSVSSVRVSYSAIDGISGTNSTSM